MRADQESIQQIIRDTVSLLCRNTLSYDIGIRIQGLIGITVDESQVFLVQFDESYHSDVNGSEGCQQQNLDGRSSPVTFVADVSKTNARKRRRLSEATDIATVCNTSTSDAGDYDVIFVADDVNDNTVKLEFDQFHSSVDNSNCNYVRVGDNSQMLKTENPLTATDLNVYTDDEQNQINQVKCDRSRNTLLRNMLANENIMSEEDTGWQPESVSCEEITMQAVSVRHEQTTARPRIKQVLTGFIGRSITMSKHMRWTIGSGMAQGGGSSLWRCCIPP